MFQNIRQLAVLNKIFNVRRNEWSRIWVAWMIRFFYNLSFVLGWTVLVVLFVSRYGISALPYLFILNALFTIIGSFFYSSFIDKLKDYQVMLVSVVGAGLLLFTASRVFDFNMVLFFGLLIVAVAIFLVQFRIALLAYIEKMFTPLESERTFPVIEAADTVGGIFAGLIVLSLSNVLEISSFIFLWLGILFLLIPLILLNENTGVATLSLEHERKKHLGVVTKLRSVFAQTKYVGFIKGLFLIVFLQWVIYNLLEFQYTRAVYRNVSEVVLQAGSGFEHAFVHDLGALFVLFSASALLIQLFLGSRVISYLGVVGTMLVHGVLTLFSIVGMIFSFNFYTAVLAKNNFTIGSVLFNNSYHSSYYAIHHSLREHIRELLEGVVRPLGAVAGTLALIILQALFFKDMSVLSVNTLMLIATFLISYAIYRQQKKYTQVAIDDLLHSKVREARMNAVDILAQKGHSSAFSVLHRVLFDNSEPLSLRVRIVKVLPELNDSTGISDLIACLKSDQLAIRSMALDSLWVFPGLKKSSKHFLYKKYQLMVALRKLYSIEKNPQVVSKIIRLMSGLSIVATIGFLLEILKTAKSHHKAEVLYALRNYDDPDIIPVIMPYMSSKSPAYRVNAAIALYNFPKCRGAVMKLLNEFLNSQNEHELAYGIFAIGELKLSGKRKICRRYLNSEQNNLSVHSAIALMKLDSDEGFPALVSSLVNGDRDLAIKVKNLLQNVDVRISQNFDSILRQVVEREIDEIVSENEAVDIWSPSRLIKLRKLYVLAEEYEQVELIDNYLNKH